MDEIQAYQHFLTTGKIEDYLKYKQIANSREEKQTDANYSRWPNNRPEEIG